MKKLYLIIIVILFGINNVWAEEENVKFSSCVDGDTIKVLVGSKEKTVRFLAVDTPESVHPTKGIEYYGKEASNYTCEMVTNAKKIVLEYDAGSDKTDKYDRLLAWVFVDGELLQDLLVKNSYAEVAYLYGDYKYTALLQDHEKVAEASGTGIWDNIAREKFDPNEEKKETADISTNDLILLGGVIAFTFIFGNNKKIKKAIRRYKKISKS